MTEHSAITIRRATPADAAAMARLRYETVHAVNAHDYTPEQLRAWAPEPGSAKAWQARQRTRITWVAVDDTRAGGGSGDNIVGFAELERNGRIDCVYTHKDHVGRGVGRAMLQALEADAVKRGFPKLIVEASITARPFFERFGYRVLRRQTVNRHGVALTNFVMEKQLLPGMKIAFRPLRDDELDAAHAIIAEATDWLLGRGIRQWTQVYPRELYAQSQKRGENFALFDGDVLLAVVTLAHCTLEHWLDETGPDPQWWLMRLAASKQHHGQGFGRLALLEALHHLYQQAATHVWLDCLDNDFLPRFYEEAGFEAIEHKVVTYPSGDFDMVLMRRNLYQP